MIANEVDKLPKALSELEETFALQLQEAGITDYVREFKFDLNRNWRADFHILDTDYLIDLSGGIWMQKSGHNTAKGIQRDYEKSNAAQIAGFIYLQFTKKEIDNRVAIDTIKHALEVNKC